MFICNECGKTFEELKKYYEDKGPQGTIMEDTYFGCPYCESDEVEYATECKKCGELVAESEEFLGYCEDCMEDIKSKYNNVNKLYEVCDKQDITEKIVLNDFLVYAFTRDEIEQILLNELKKSKETDFEDYVNQFEIEIVNDYESEE